MGEALIKGMAMQSGRRRAKPQSALRTLGVYLALLALLIQSALPLADAAFHAALSTAGEDDTDRVAAAHVAPGDAITIISNPAPAHLAHACPICQFISSLGGFAPPIPARAVAPVWAPRFAVWPAAPPARRSAAASAAQPRAPPVLI